MNSSTSCGRYVVAEYSPENTRKLSVPPLEIRNDTLDPNRPANGATANGTVNAVFTVATATVEPRPATTDVGRLFHVRPASDHDPSTTSTTCVAVVPAAASSELRNRNVAEPNTRPAGATGNPNRKNISCAGLPRENN